MKKMLITVALLAVPAAAYAMGGRWGGGYPAGPAAGHLAAVLYALMAALGYWVLQHASRQECALVKRTGQALAWVLLVLGVLGLLCGVMTHAARSMSGRCCPAMGGAGQARVAVFKAGEEGAEWDMKVDEAAGKGGERTIKVRLQSDKKEKAK